MQRIIRRRAIAASIATAAVLLGASAAAASAASTPVTRTFSFVARGNSKTVTIVNIDQFLMNARCNSGGAPVIFGFSFAPAGDIEAHMIDGLGRVHVAHNTSFSKGQPGILLSTTSGDFDSTGTALFESSSGNVVTVTYAYDNATTLNRQNVCTVYGSYTAT